MAKLWEVDFYVRYTTEVEAESQEDAEDLAYNDFMETEEYWDVEIGSSLLWDDEDDMEEDDDDYEDEDEDDDAAAAVN